MAGPDGDEFGIGEEPTECPAQFLFGTGRFGDEFLAIFPYTVILITHGGERTRTELLGEPGSLKRGERRVFEQAPLSLYTAGETIAARAHEEEIDSLGESIPNGVKIAHADPGVDAAVGEVKDAAGRALYQPGEMIGEGMQIWSEGEGPNFERLSILHWPEGEMGEAGQIPSNDSITRPGLIGQEGVVERLLDKLENIGERGVMDMEMGDEDGMRDIILDLFPRSGDLIVHGARAGDTLEYRVDEAAIGEPGIDEDAEAVFLETEAGMGDEADEHRGELTRGMRL